MIPARTLVKLFTIGMAAVILIMTGKIMIGFALEFWFAVELLSIGGKKTENQATTDLTNDFKKVFGKNDTNN